MSIDVVDLREFYATPLGKAASASITTAIRKYGDLADADAATGLMGIGYPVAVLDTLVDGTGPNAAMAAHALVCMPARQGAIKWPVNGQSRTVLIDEETLPLETGSVQCIVAIHLLENALDPAAMLDEIWRVLVPEGRLILVAANRRGLWTRFEHTPFGHGRPFSRGQLGGLMRKAKLTPVRWGDCLNFPPMRYRRLMKTYPWVERVAHRVWPVFCGAYVVTAKKRLYQGITGKKAQEKRVFVPVLGTQGAARNNRAGRD